MQKEGIQNIIAKVTTWPRNSHNLLDYDSKYVNRTTIKCKGPTFITRTKNSVEFTPTIRKESELIGRIKYTNSSLGLHPASLCDHPREKSEKLWLIVKSLNKYKLAEGDVLRLGKDKFRIKEIKTENEEKPEFSLLKKLEFLDDENESEVYEHSFPCRVCLSEIHTLQNPLISPCKCSGSIKFIHKRCLQRAIKSKLKTQSSDYALSFLWKNLRCELCGKQYPNRMKVAGEIIDLFDLPKPPSPYIILESLSTNNFDSKGLHIVTFCAKSEILVGRGHNSDLRLSEISISRTHALLKKTSGGIFIQDTKSKFGTVVQIKRPIPLDAKTSFQVQANNTVIDIKVSKEWNFLPSCFRSSEQATNIFSEGSPQLLPLLPINTGIPLSVEKFDVLTRQNSENKNLLLDTSEDNEELEEVEVAEFTKTQEEGTIYSSSVIS